MFSASVEQLTEGESRGVPHTLYSMVDAFNSLNQVCQQILTNATKLADEVCYGGTEQCCFSQQEVVLVCLQTTETLKCF